MAGDSGRQYKPLISLQDSVHWPLIVLALPSKSQHDGTHFSRSANGDRHGQASDKFIRELQVEEGEKEAHKFDDECPGLAVRKQASGHTTFFVKYTVAGKGQQRKKTLAAWEPGIIAAICKEAKVLISEANMGIDRIGDAQKAQEATKKSKTLGEQRWTPGQSHHPRWRPPCRTSRQLPFCHSSI